MVLAKAREKKNLTHAQVAKILGVSRSFYGLIEIGKRRPTYGMALKLAEIYEVDPSELFFDLKRFKLNQKDPNSAA